MTAVHEMITINAGKTRVWDAYVNHINEWWPRQGEKFTYSFGPMMERQPRHIRFEAGPDGHLYERFDDETEFIIGRITAWEPPDHLAYTWRDPRWPADTTVNVTFEEAEGVTTVTIVHDGFGEEGVPDVAAGYQEGGKEIMGAFRDWVLEQIALEGEVSNE